MIVAIVGIALAIGWGGIAYLVYLGFAAMNKCFQSEDQEPSWKLVLTSILWPFVLGAVIGELIEPEG